MKKMNLKPIVILLLMLIFQSCGETVSKAEYDKVVAEKTMLEKRYKKGIKSNPVGSINKAKNMISNFHNAGEIKIPTALYFQSEHLNNLTDSFPGIRFYFSIHNNSDTLRLIAVGVKDKNIDIINEYLVDGDTTTNMINYTDPCPPCAVSSTSYSGSPSILNNLPHSYYSFTKQR